MSNNSDEKQSKESISNKFKFLSELPQYEFKLPNMPKDMVEPPLDFSKIKLDPPSYEDTILRDMANDIKAPFERQISAVEKIAESAESQSESAKKIADTARDEADRAIAESLRSKKKADKSFIVSVIALGFTVLINA